MALRKQRRPFLATLWAAVPAILLSIAATYALSRLGALNGLERLALDAEMAPTPRQEVPISIVDINDSDYNNIFSGTSPLNPDKLHSLISAVAKSKPAVIGIDIDTSDRQFRTFKPESNWPTVIWERDIASLPAGNDAELEPLDVLGAQDPKRDEMSGIPVLLDDPEDKETRFYTRCVETKAGLQRTFVSAVVEAYRSARQKKKTCRSLRALQVFQIPRAICLSSILSNKNRWITGTHRKFLAAQKKHGTPRTSKSLRLPIIL